MAKATKTAGAKAKGARGIRAGGRATEAGMSFQAEVGASLAAMMLADAPVGPRFGLGVAEKVADLRLETGIGVDDIVLTLTGGGSVSLQCKTSLSLSPGAGSEFAKTVTQCVEAMVAEPKLSPDSSALVIALPFGVSNPLDGLDHACRRVAAGGLGELSKGSQAEQAAFSTFKAALDRAWSALKPGAPVDYRQMAGLVRVVRFDRGVGGAMRREATALLGRALYGGESAGAPPFLALLDIIREMIKSGHPTTRGELLGEMRRRGHVDTDAPGFDPDINRIRAHTALERDRLGRFGRLSLDDYSLVRNCQAELTAAVRSGSLLVIGEPGAGKSGALGALAADWAETGPVVVLSVDQFAGITRTRDISDELRLEHDLVEVLAAWPGASDGLLVLDALDAARGGQAERIFIRLIASVARSAPNWRVVASVRTFDLLNGHSLRDLMPGAPPSAGHSDPRAAAMRHFLIPALDDEERIRLAGDLPQLAVLLASPNTKLSRLMSNIFNLSLAADLLAKGAAPSSFNSITTQSDLIDRYEDRRLPATPARSAMIAAIAAMVGLGKMTLRIAELDHPGVTALLQSGMVEERDGRYAFAHHILFDHAAGRYFIDTDSHEALVGQLRSLGAKAFMLAPALRFALERFWRADQSGGRTLSWRLLLALAQQRDLGPIGAASALRAAAEQVAGPSDLDGLASLIDTGPSEIMGNTLFQIARFVAMRAEAEGLPQDAVMAWAGLAERIAVLRDRAFIEPARFLLYPLSKHADLSDPPIRDAFGRAARAGLAAACAQGERYRHARSMNIEFIGRSFASDPDASAAVLAPLLTETWLDKYGHEDAAPLAEAAERIVGIDDDFVAAIFFAILNHPLPDDTKTDMSGSRILGLSSTRRQDFTSSFHHLGKAFQRTLDVVPSRGPALLSIHALAKREAKRSDAPSRISIDLPDRKSVIFEDTLDLIDWRQTPAHASGSDINIPRAFADHVARVPLADLEPIIVAALGIEAAASVWRRLLGAQRLETRRSRTDALLWPIATNPAVLESPDLARDAIDYIRAAYSTTSDDDRRAFEETVLAWNPKDAKRWRVQLARLLTALPPDHIATEEMRRRRSDLEREGGLAGNPAAISHAPDSARFLRAGSSTPAATPTAEAEGRLARALANHGRGPNERRVKALWSAIVKTVDLIERDTLDPESSTELWRAVGEALIHLVASSAWMSGETAQPPKDAVLALLRRIIALSAPTERDYQPTPRGRAGVALLHMAARFPDEAPALLDIIRELVIDPNPGVRETVADRLCWLNKDLPEMAWPLIDQMAATETDHTVLTVLLAHTLNSLSPSDPDRVEAALRVIDGRAHELEPGEHTQVIEMISHVAVRLAVETGRPSAMTLIEDWTATSPIRGDRLAEVLPMLRTSLFFRYDPAKEIEIGNRTMRIGHRIARGAAAQLGTAKERLSALPDTTAQDAPERLELIEAYRDADRVLDQLGVQLYHGSGAYNPSGARDAPLATRQQKNAFFDDWSEVLADVEAVATPATLKHLVEVYEYLLDADPPRYFARIAAVVTGPAALEYYQFESLAETDLVKFVRRMLADHRALFDDQARLDELIALLDLFAQAGWPESMRLLWELPDLLR